MENIMKRFGKSSPKKKKLEPKLTPQQTALSYLRDFVVLIICVLLISSLLFRVVIVSGPSMNNTLVDGDWLLLLNSAISGDPEHGDIIVASKDSYKDGEPIIKRVIAVAGDVVDISPSGEVTVNGEIVDEPYSVGNTRISYDSTYLDFPLTVDDGCLFVMGDNREHSLDSRRVTIGLIDCREVLGTAIFLMFPGYDDLHPEREYDRIGAL